MIIDKIILDCLFNIRMNSFLEPFLCCLVFDFINDVIIVVIKEVTTDSGGFAIRVFKSHYEIEIRSGVGSDGAGGWLVIAAVYNQVFSVGTLFKAHCVVPRGVKSKFFLDVENFLSRLASSIIDLVVEALMVSHCFHVFEVHVCGLSGTSVNEFGGQSQLDRASSLTVFIVFISESPAINFFFVLFVIEIVLFSKYREQGFIRCVEISIECNTSFASFERFI